MGEVWAHRAPGGSPREAGPEQHGVNRDRRVAQHAGRLARGRVRVRGRGRGRGRVRVRIRVRVRFRVRVRV